MADLLAFGASALELTPPENDRLETADRVDVAVTGPESNAAIAASRLGVETAWLSKLPATPLGRRVTGALGKYGVETAVHWSEAGRQGLAFTERAGPPRGNAHIHDRAETAVASATPDELPLSSVREASMVYTSGATVALSETLAETTAALFEDSEATTVLGLGRPRAFESPAAREAVIPLLATTDVFVTTEAGAAALGQRGSPPETAHALAAAHDFETVVLARGERGACVWHERTVHEHTPSTTETVDDRGAFDALCGGFLARRLAGAGPNRALAAGVACAALARTLQGPHPTITSEEVERCIDSMDDER
jgi:2-dehydro-3-deoxygluconokinase